MSILQISRIQQRRGLQQDLPQLASAELGWSIDSQRLFIGNGTLAEGAPAPGVTEILTQNSVAIFATGVSGNITALQSNVGTLQTQVAGLLSGSGATTTLALSGSSSGTILGITANNAVVNYTLTQGTRQRTGTIKLAQSIGTSTVSSDEEYTESVTTDLVFTVTANSTSASLNYTTTTATALKYQVISIT